MNNFQDKNIVITGGSSGIGLALAKQLAELGGKIWLIARNEEKLKNALQTIPEKNRGGYFSIDISKMDSFQPFKNNWGQDLKIDCLINSAGVAHPGTFDDLPIEIFREMMDINYFGTVNTIKLLTPYFSESAHIVNIASMAAVLGVYGYTAYGASKYAVRGFSDVLRSEFLLTGKKVSLVYPPDTETPQLEYENQFKPKITKEIAGSAGALTADAVAKEIILGIQKNRYLIIPGVESKVIFAASNLLGRLIYPIMDIMVRSAAKKNQ